MFCNVQITFKGVSHNVCSDKYEVTCWLKKVRNLTFRCSCLCPSPTVPNLLPNEDELTIRVCSSDHSWSFLVILAMTMTMTINSNSVLWYESFEHVQKVCVPSTNNFHSCLKCVVIVFVAQLTCCILVILTVYYVIHACNISDEQSANVTR